MQCVSCQLCTFCVFQHMLQQDVQLGVNCEEKITSSYSDNNITGNNNNITSSNISANIIGNISSGDNVNSSNNNSNNNNNDNVNKELDDYDYAAEQLLLHAASVINQQPSPISSAMLAYNSLVGATEAHVTVPSVSIPGLIYLRDYITADEEMHIVHQILDRHPWCCEIARRTQMYGYTYYHTRHNLPDLQPPEQQLSAHASLPMHRFQFLVDRIVARDRLFDSEPVLHTPTQVLVNEYVDRNGIASHVDSTEAFGDVIVLISLLSPIYMTLKMCPDSNHSGANYPDSNHSGAMETKMCPSNQPDANYPDNQPDSIGTKVCPSNHSNPVETKILLEPRSLLVMKDDVRFKWQHGITKMKHLHIPSLQKTIVRDASYRRLSLTFRVVKTSGTKKVSQNDPKPKDCFW